MLVIVTETLAIIQTDHTSDVVPIKINYLILKLDYYD